jgi:hypothetical protein
MKAITYQTTRSHNPEDHLGNLKARLTAQISSIPATGFPKFPYVMFV